MNIEELKRIAEKVGPPSPAAEEAGRLYRCAIALADQCDFNSALAAADKITLLDFKLRTVFRDEAYIYIISRMADEGETDRALALCDVIESSSHRDGALASVAYSLAMQERWQEARSACGSIEDRRRREEVVAAIDQHKVPW